VLLSLVSGGLVALFGAAWKIASTLTNLENMNANLDKDMKAVNAKLDVIIAALAALAGVPNALRSMGLAVQQVADGQALSALAAATPAQLAALLRDNSLGQYAQALGHLSGAEALLQTDESLRNLGVAEGHIMPLLTLLSKQQ
jgi:3-oxoacyl-ACP reductase-like protein